ncbi:LacI family DNA-binding transcriptional regulator [Listeria costaricensis]|uniref:LacI family DNA-binding transcriptional regulator n=1 Tax=Listeria costaricensis TaxID=2026604 RepID=UPI000C085004|nr:substrate-binding domain-containing protein [Listeria costaricensis]
MSVTIREIAEKTGVSITAISQILNGKGDRFSEATKKRVLETAKEMAYKPNFFAKNMITSHTNTIGMIVPQVTDAFFSQMVKGAEDYLNRYEYMIMLCNTSNDKEREDQYVEELLHRAVDGLIIASPNILASQVFERLRGKNKPFILLDRQRNEQKEGRIAVDDYEGGYMATKHLIELGHRAIGIIIADASFYNVFERFEGYKACMRDYGITVKQEWITSGDQTMEGGYQATHALMKTEITALFATNDLMAVGAYRAALECGKRVPDDLSVIGFDDIELSEFMTPPLTTIRQPIYQLGEIAAQFLLRKIEHPEEKMGNCELDLTLIERGSTKRIDSQQKSNV